MKVLEGIRVVDFTQHQAGPYGTTVLADLGADVIKVERPGEGDPARTNHPKTEGVNAFFLTNNRGKRSVCIDLARPGATELTDRLVERADVFVHNLRPGSFDKFGLGSRQVREKNPKIIYAVISTFGPSGPRWQTTGVDLVAQAESGLMSVTGPQDGDPMPAGAAIADAMAGMNLAFAVVSALFQRERTGRGQEVQVSLVGSLLALQAWELQHYLLSRTLPRKADRGHPLINTLWTTFPARDGAFVVAEVSDSWGSICRAIGRPEVADEDRFRSVGRRLKYRPELRKILEERFRQWSVEGCVSRLREEGVLAAPVRDYKGLAEDEDVRANGYIRSMEHPEKGPIESPGPVLHFLDTPLDDPRPAPALGEHTDQILRELGYRDDELAKMRDEAIVA